MTPFVVAIGFLVLLGSVLSLAEAAISRTTAARARALREQGHRNAVLLLRVAEEPARHLNVIHLCVMFAQNGAVILVALLAERYWGGLGVTVAAVAFTLAYFVVVEAMSKALAIRHRDRVALLLAPFVWSIASVLSSPTRALVGLANVMLRGQGDTQGPLVTELEIRSLAEAGHKEGVIEQHEKEIIQSAFQFGDRPVRDVMVPRPDIIATDVASPLEEVARTIMQHGFTRVPAYRGDLDHIDGMVHAKDVLELLYQGRRDEPLAQILRPVRFVPESKRLAELMHEMQEEKFHLAIVSDEYGSVSGLVTLEDVLEEIVGQIRDEYDREAPDVTPLGGGRYRVNAALPIVELNQVLSARLPRDRWNTVGGLVYGLAGAIPAAGASVEIDAFRFTVEKVQGRRILTVVVTPLSPAAPDVPPASGSW